MTENELDMKGIVELASAFYGSAVLFAAIENDVFTRVGEAGDAATAARVAQSAQSEERGMRLLLDACVALGLLAKDGDVYRNTQAGALSLVAGSPLDLSKAVLYNRDVYPAWGRLSQFVQTARPVEQPEIHLGNDAMRTRSFVLSMRGRAMAIGHSAVPMLDLSGCKKLLDLAGGPGTYACMIAKANLALECVTVDLPAVSAVANECVAESGMSHRVKCRAGDYHTDEYEAGAYDAVTIFGALHQESPAQIVDILKRANRALAPGGKLFVMDMMTDATHTQPTFSALFAVNMALTTHNGWVFADSELKGWMREAGFVPDDETKHVPPPMPHWIVSAVKA